MVFKVVLQLWLWLHAAMIVLPLAAAVLLAAPDKPNVTERGGVLHCCDLLCRVVKKCGGRWRPWNGRHWHCNSKEARGHRRQVVACQCQECLWACLFQFVYFSERGPEAIDQGAGQLREANSREQLDNDAYLMVTSGDVYIVLQL